MHINIAVAAGLNLLRGHKELLIQLLVKLIENQASLGGDKGAVCVGVFLVAHIHDGLTFFVDVVHHPHEILLVIPVIPVTFCYDGFYFLQGAFHNIMHNGDRNLILLQFCHFINYILANMLFFLFCKLRKRTVCAFPYRINYLLHIKSFQASILLNYLDHSLWLKHFPIIYTGFCKSSFFTHSQNLHFL